MARAPVDLIALWRECIGAGAEFVGPIEPPMVSWLRLGALMDAWQLAAAERHAPAPVQLELPLDAAA